MGCILLKVNIINIFTFSVVIFKVRFYILFYIKTLLSKENFTRPSRRMSYLPTFYTGTNLIRKRILFREFYFSEFYFSEFCFSFKSVKPFSIDVVWNDCFCSQIYILLESFSHSLPFVGDNPSWKVSSLSPPRGTRASCGGSVVRPCGVRPALATAAQTTLSKCHLTPGVPEHGGATAHTKEGGAKYGLHVAILKTKFVKRKIF